MSKRKVKLYISMSLDGFIAGNDDDISWLDAMDKDGEDYGYFDFVKSVDAYIIGRSTYDKVLTLTGGKFPYEGKFDNYVMTRKERENENGVKFYSGDIADLIAELRQKEGKDIYCDGGGQVVKLLMEKDLIDEYIIAVIPIILGDGKRLFIGGVDSINIKALPPKYFDTGLVQLHYIRSQG